MKKKNLFEGAASTEPPVRDDVAVIGIAVNLPGAADEASLLRLLRDGADQTREFPAHRVADVAKFVDYYQPERGESPRFFRGAWLERVDQFDRRTFRMSASEAALCDPHQRLFLQAAWQAIHDAGYGGDALKGSRTAVIACGDTKKGISYLNLVTEQAFDMLPLALTGNNASYTPARLSFLLDLQGPASVVDTGCCSSLVGVHQACHGLLSGEYDCAVVGSSELNFLPLDTGLRVGIESADGATRSFAADATGTGLGEGAVAVVLKRAQDALRDGDAIHAVIRGSAVNHSGRAAGLTVPTAAGQADAIDEAWRRAGVHPDEIAYVEAHGTGTPLGDPIEFEGLTLAFRRRSAALQTCAIGTFKSQIGHLMNSAGLAGFVKAVMTVKHGELFPSLHFTAPNASIDFPASPYYVNDRLRPWPAQRARIAGVSSYSMTGTNCHVVVAAAGAAPDRPRPPLPAMQLERHWVDPRAGTLFEARAGGGEGVGDRLRALVEPWLRARLDDPASAGLLAQIEALDTVDRAADGVAQRPLRLTGDVDQDRAPLTAFVRRSFARKLGLADVDPDASITDLGGDSMSVIQIVGTLNKQVAVLLGDVYAHPSVNGLVERLLARSHDEASKPEVFARRVAEMDALLDDRARLADQERQYLERSRAAMETLGPLTRDESPRTVLLTGATGFMGAHFLHRLLARPGWRVIAPVRAQTPALGLARLQAAHGHHHGRPMSEEELARLTVVGGDLGAPRFGLPETLWQDLCERTDEIIHLAARVRHSGDDTRFQHDNVSAVEQVIACATAGRRKRVHFASSTAVAHGHYTEPPLVRLYTEFDRAPAPAYNNPYSRSKVAAEVLLDQARQDGLVVNTYRFGNVLFHSRSGQFQTNVEENGIYSLIRAFAVLGCHPDSPRKELDFGFVDEMTDAFFAVFDRPSLDQGCYHLFNEHGVSVNEVCAGIAALGLPMRRLPLGEFVRHINTPEIKARHGRIVDRLLFHIGYLTLDLDHVSTLWEIDNLHTRQLLADCGFRWSPVDAAHIERMVRGCPDPGFFPTMEAAR